MVSLWILVSLHLNTVGVIILVQADHYIEKLKVCWAGELKTWDTNFQKSFQKLHEEVDSNAVKETLHWAGTQHNIMYKMWVISNFQDAIAE